MFIVHMFQGLSGLHILHPWYWNTLFYGLISLGDFSTCVFSSNYSQSLHHSFLIPPSTHQCCVGRTTIEWEVCLNLLHTTSSVIKPQTYWSWFQTLSTRPHVPIKVLNLHQKNAPKHPYYRSRFYIEEEWRKYSMSMTAYVLCIENLGWGLTLLKCWISENLLVTVAYNPYGRAWGK